MQFISLGDLSTVRFLKACAEALSADGFVEVGAAAVTVGKIFRLDFHFQKGFFKREVAECAVASSVIPKVHE